MSFLFANNVKIRGVAACVPARVEENRDYKLASPEDIEKFIKTTGVERRHCAIHDGSICTSDLCYKAADKLIADLKWDKSEIGLIVFVSHTTDYKLPSTACIMQDRLSLSTNCLAFDITQGCPGYVIGLGTVCSLLQNGTIKKALLMVGNTQSEYASYEDKSMHLLLGDAGTVTALEYNPENADIVEFNYTTYGAGKDFLIVPDGGSRNPTNANSFVMEEFEGGIRRTRLHEKMDGAEVYSYALRLVPSNFKALVDYFQIQTDQIDYLLIHQANRYLCEKLRKKLGFKSDQCPYNINEFGNTSGATIPLLMVTNLREELQTRPLKLMMTAVGVGFALGSGYITTDRIVCPELMYL